MRQEYKLLREKSWQEAQLASEFLGHIDVFGEMLSRTLGKIDQQDRERHEAKKRQVSDSNDLIMLQKGLFACLLLFLFYF